MLFGQFGLGNVTDRSNEPEILSRPSQSCPCRYAGFATIVAFAPDFVAFAVPAAFAAFAVAPAHLPGSAADVHSDGYNGLELSACFDLPSAQYLLAEHLAVRHPASAILRFTKVHWHHLS